MGSPSNAQWSDLRNGDAVKAWESLPASDRWDTVFGTSPFLEAITDHSSVGVEQITIEDDRGCSAAARLAVRPYFGSTLSPVPPFTAFSAIRLRDDLREAQVHERATVLEDLLHAVERRFHAASIHLPPAVEDTRVFGWRGWKVRPLYTYRIPLSDSDHPLDAWSESARRTARQEAAGFEVVETDAETQARLVVESYSRNNRKPPLGVEQISSMVRSLLNDGAAAIAAVRNRGSGEVEASVTILRHGREAYYWLAGGRRGAAMTVLLAHVLPDLASSGIDVFDFVGANTASIAEFKRKFGGRLTTYFRATWERGIPGRLFARMV